jgi:hypothetical protein
MKIEIDMDDKDFHALSEECWMWSELSNLDDGQWETTGEPYNGSLYEFPDSTWQWTYGYVFKDWLGIVVARSFLKAYGHDCEVLYRMHKIRTKTHFILLTNFGR